MSLHTPAVRPTFDVEVSLTPAQVASALSLLMNQADGPVIGRQAGHHLMLTVPDADRHFWSPWLTIEARLIDDQSSNHEPHAESARSNVHGRFSPAPNLWTAIMFMHLSLITIAFFAVMFGLSQMMLKQPPHALWVTAGCLLASLLLWWVSLLGQRVAHVQMHTLHDAVTEVLGD